MIITFSDIHLRILEWSTDNKLHNNLKLAHSYLNLGELAKKIYKIKRYLTKGIIPFKSLVFLRAVVFHQV